MAPDSASSATSSSRPARVRVELEAQTGVEGEPLVEPRGRGRIAETSRDDERNGPRLSSERRAERASRLPEGEVERRALEAPASVVVVRVLGGLGVEEREGREVLRERVQRPRARERQVRPALLEPVVLLAVVRDVLADALLAPAEETNERRLAEEVRSCLQREELELVALDAQRKVADGVVQAHRPANATDTSPASRAFATASARLTSRVRPSERSCSRASTNGVTPCPVTPCARGLGDGLLDQLVDVDALGRRVREEQPAARRGSSARRRSELPWRRRRRAASRAARRPRCRRAEACPSGSRARGCRGSRGTPSSPGCRGATSRPSRRRATGAVTSATRSAETSGGDG